MSEIDLYEIGRKLLGDEPAEGQFDTTAIRLGQLQGIIDQVNAALAQRSGPTERAAAAGMVTAPDRVSKEAGAPRQARLARLHGMKDQEAAGAVLAPARPDPVLDPDLTPAAALTIIHSAHAAAS